MNSLQIDSWEKLIELFAQEFDMSNSNAWPFVDLTSQEVGVHVDEAYGDPSSEEDLEGHELVEIDPKESSEGFNIMERFAMSRPDAEADKLFNALHRRHPFAMFRSAGEYLGILQEWYKFKDEALEVIAADRLRDCDIEFRDGKIVCTNPANISVFHCDGADDANE